MASSKDGAWEAICVDLDIAVQGRSFSEVQESLRQSINMFLERVAELPENERYKLLNRRAPWLLRAKFNLLSALSRVGRDGNDHHRSFIVPTQRSGHAPA
jgi:hypothetical protein